MHTCWWHRALEEGGPPRRAETPQVKQSISLWCCAFLSHTFLTLILCLHGADLKMKILCSLTFSVVSIYLKKKKAVFINVTVKGTFSEPTSSRWGSPRGQSLCQGLDRSLTGKRRQQWFTLTSPWGKHANMKGKKSDLNFPTVRPEYFNHSGNGDNSGIHSSRFH